jgi:diaminopimelate decarboxylase
LRSYVSVDSGMSGNIRTALYGADYLCLLASRESTAPAMLSRLVGRHCESGDIVVRDGAASVLLRRETAADLLALDEG